MSDLKTTPNDKSVQTFLEAVENETKRQDRFTILEHMRNAQG